MRSIAAILLLIAIAFSGCSEASEVPPNVEGPTKAEEGLQATDSTGVIRGVVVDDAIAPLAGVTVSIKALELSATTLDDGSFGFADLEPGVHVLQASKPGYTTTQSTATVEAAIDKPPIVRIQLPLAPGTAPYIVPYQFDGIMTCSFEAGAPGVGSLGGNVCGEVDGLGTAPIGDLALEKTPDFIQSELSWRNSQQLGDELAWMLSWECTTNAGFLCDHTVSGTSPLVNKMDADTINGQRFEGTPFGPERNVLFRVFAEASDTTAGVLGVTLEQKVETFSFVFYNHVPDESWSFVQDGEYQLPA